MFTAVIVKVSVAPANQILHTYLTAERMEPTNL